MLRIRGFLSWKLIVPSCQEGNTVPQSRISDKVGRVGGKMYSSARGEAVL